jgi:hypothetical protein
MRGSLGEKIGEGSSADIHAWAPGQVVKLFKPGGEGRLCASDWDPISGLHQGQQPERLHRQAEYMAAPERFAERSDSACNAGAVHTWHWAEFFGTAATQSGYEGTFTVPPRRPAYVLLTRFGRSCPRAARVVGRQHSANRHVETGPPPHNTAKGTDCRFETVLI